MALANPDLVERVRANTPLNAPDPNTFYGGGAAGYTDYPTYAARAEHPVPEGIVSPGRPGMAATHTSLTIDESPRGSGPPPSGMSMHSLLSRLPPTDRGPWLRSHT